MNATLEGLKKKIANSSTEELNSLEFAKKLFLGFGENVLAFNSSEQNSLFADLLVWEIQGELYSRKAGAIKYSYGELYLFLGIPKYFLDKLIIH